MRAAVSRAPALQQAPLGGRPGQGECHSKSSNPPAVSQFSQYRGLQTPSGPSCLRTGSAGGAHRRADAPHHMEHNCLPIIAPQAHLRQVLPALVPNGVASAGQAREIQGLPSSRGWRSRAAAAARRRLLAGWLRPLPICLANSGLRGCPLQRRAALAAACRAGCQAGASSTAGCSAVHLFPHHLLPCCHHLCCCRCHLLVGVLAERLDAPSSLQSCREGGSDVCAVLP